MKLKRVFLILLFMLGILFLKNNVVNSVYFPLGSYAGIPIIGYASQLGNCPFCNLSLTATSVYFEKNATCTETGMKLRKYVCIHAAHKATDPHEFFVITSTTSALGHKWDSGTVTTASTCTTKGKKLFKCTRSGCTATKTQSLPLDSTAHTWGSWTTTKAATCTSTGLQVKYCKNCGTQSSETNTLKALGHNYSNKVTAATCTAKGYTTHTCTRCGYNYKDTYTNALGHNYSNKVTAPTCTAKGYTTHTCTRCGNNYKDTYTNALGHKYKVTANVAATCAKDGYKTEKCSRCGNTKTTTYKATGAHQFVNGVCKVCGFKNPGGGEDVHIHTWAQATCYKPKTCTSCGETEGTALGHNFVNGVCTRCGLQETGEDPTDEWIILSEENNIKARVIDNNILEVVGNGNIRNFTLPDGEDPCPLYPIKSRFTKVHIKGKLTNLPAYFLYYHNIEEIIIDYPETIENIGYGAFWGCKELKSFDMPKNIKSIEAYSFYHCHILETIDLSKCLSLVRIGNSAFRDCWLLNTVKLPEGLKIIGYEAFFNDISLNNVILPSTIKAIGTKGLEDNEEGLGLENQLNNEEKTLGNTNGFNNVFTIDFTRNSGNEHTNFIELVLARNSYMEITDLLTTTRVWYYPSNELLRQYAEQKATNEMKISTTSWDISEKRDNTIIASLTVEGKLIIIGQGATLNYEAGKVPWDEFKDKITEIEIGEGITVLGNNLFYNHNNVKTVTMPSTLREINDGVFQGCYNLESIEIPENVKDIGAYAFAHCEKLNAVIIPRNIKAIREGTFSNCYKLQTVDIKGDIVRYEDKALFNCPSLHTFTISPYIEELGADIFKVDFTLNEDTRYLEFNNLELNNVVYYKISEVSQEYTINNTERDFESIDLDGLAIKTVANKIQYFENEDIDTTGLVLTANYYNGTTKDNLIARDLTEDYEYSPKKVDEVGTKEITITYAKKTLTYQVEVIKIEPTSIYVENEPIKTEYNKGEELDTEGLSIVVVYNNEDTKSITEGFTCDPIVLNNAGEQTVTVAYENLTAAFNVNVISNIVENIAIVKLPNKIEYEVGETLETEGLAIIVTYEDGRTEKITDGFTFTPEVLEEVGEQQITISYGGKITTFEVVVLEKEDQMPAIIGIDIETEPNKKEYSVGDVIDLDGLVLAVTYEDGTTQNITEGFKCTPQIVEQEGEQGVVVKYQGAETSFTVIVNKVEVTSIKVKSEPNQKTYNVGDVLNIDGLVLEASYSNGETKVITKGFVCTPTVLEKEGKQIITMSYKGKTTTFNVTVNKVEETEAIVFESDKYSLEGEFLTYVQPNTKAKTLIEEIKPTTNAQNIVIYKDQTIINEETNVATGMKIEFTLGKISKNYIIIVIGDTNGDGQTDIKDIVQMNKHSLAKKILKGASLLAGDVVRDGIIDIKDIVKVNKFNLNKITKL